MSFPRNPELTSDIIKDDFFAALEMAETQRFYSRLTTPKSQSDITTTYTSLGSVPEPSQSSGVAGGGPNQAVNLNDFILPATVNVWKSTIYRERIVAESRPDDTREIPRKMAFKAQKVLDKDLCTQLISTTNNGYDGVPVISDAHPESGTSQDNNLGSNVAVPTAPTAAELEASLNEHMDSILGFTDDQGTPVNEGVDRFIILCPPGMYNQFLTVGSDKIGATSADATTVTGVYRGRLTVISSAFCTDTGTPAGNADMFYIIADPSQSQEFPMAFCTLVDWMFANNIGDDSSDDWRKGMGFFHSYGAHVFKPWKWQTVALVTLT